MNSTSLGLEFKEEDDEDEKISKNESSSNIWKGRLHSEKLYLANSDKCFANLGSIKHIKEDTNTIPSWRMKERTKTVGGILCLCLNIGTDPPDFVKTEPCARKECWMDPKLMGSTKAIDAIAAQLQKQYERWQSHAKYKPLRDPTYKDVKKMSVQLRRVGKTERLLFHYNGHGVPKPTQNGEIWVFNKGFTEYIPMGLHELSSWLRKPVVYVFDCSGAGTLLPKIRMEATNSRRDEDQQRTKSRDVICFAACGADQQLPLNPAVPADVFTACLTTPIKMALRWFMYRNPLQLDLPKDILDRIPGSLDKRKTPIGELNWIFTSITDTIAWNVLPLPLFQKLFRQDLLIASLSRNFLLADRIMRSLHCTWYSSVGFELKAREFQFYRSLQARYQMYSNTNSYILLNCSSNTNTRTTGTPESIPALPSTARHPLWQSWDLAVEQTLYQLSPPHPQRPLSSSEATGQQQNDELMSRFQHSTFFEEQLTAFEVWLRFVNVKKNSNGSKIQKDNDVPEHLPIVLQVLLSQVHRVRALRLLAEFVDLGRWATNLTLSVGVHPYVLKLIHSKTPKLRPVLVFIWAKILDLDTSCQHDLLKSQGQKYFLFQLRHASSNQAASLSSDETNTSLVDIYKNQRWLCSYILSKLMHENRQGQEICLKSKLHIAVVEVLKERHVTNPPQLKLWLCIVLAVQFRGCDEARRASIRANVVNSLISLLKDPSSIVRASAALAIGELFGCVFENSEEEFMSRHLGSELKIVHDHILVLTSDFAVSPREEALYALARLILEPNHNIRFQAAEHAILEEKRRQRSLRSSSKDNNTASSGNDNGVIENNMFSKLNGRSLPITLDECRLYVHVWSVVRALKRNDPAQSVQRIAILLVKNVRSNMVEQLKIRGISQSSNSTSGFDSPRLQGIKASHSTMKSVGSVGHNLSSTKAKKVTGSLDPKGNHIRPGSAHVTIRKHTSGGSSSKLRTTPGTAISNESVDEILKKNPELVSPFLDLMCKKGASISLLRRSGEEDDPMSERGSVLRFRRERNRSIEKKAASRAKNHDRKKWKQSSILDNGSIMSSVLLFHPYENSIAVACGRDEIKLWNYEEGERIGAFRNGNEKPSRITSLSWVNPHDDALLLTGTDDGVCRVWKTKYDSDNSPIATFTAVPDLYPGNRGSGLVMEFQQNRGLLVATGNSVLLRCWDLTTEKCVSSVPTGSKQCVTSIASFNDNTNTVLACGDGSLHMFDLRSPISAVEVASKREHKNWIVNIHRQANSDHLLTSCSVVGDVKLWDHRNMSKSLKTLQAHREGEPCTAFAVHDYAPVFASGSHKQFIRIFDTQNSTLSRIHFHDGFLGQRIGPVSCLAFHPYKMCLAAGATDSIISIYTER